MNRQRPRYAVHLALIVICFVICLPALYALMVATQSFNDSFQALPKIGGDLFNNLIALFQRQNFGQLLLNTVIVAGVIVIGKTTLALLAGLAFVYFHFRGKTLLFFFVLLTLLMPTEIILLPLYRMMSELHWGDLNPRLALTFPFLATAAGTFLFRQHFLNLPRDLVEAAQMDGATPLRFLASILMPLSWNVIGAHALIQFISAWNQYLWPLLIVQDAAQQIIQIGVRSTLSAGTQVDLGLLMAAGIVASIPPLILFVALQNWFMRGFALGQNLTQK